MSPAEDTLRVRMLPIPKREPDTVPLLNATPFHAFPLTWQLQPPRDAMIMVVKGTFDMVQGGLATPAEEHILPTGEEPFDDAENPECLRYPGDMAFFKPKTDVFLVGRAYPARGAKKAVTLVQLAIGRALDHSVAVVGDRTWVRGAPSEPARFDSIELRADRAFGGPELESNPVGRGHGAVEGSPLPNIERHDKLIRNKADRPSPAMTTPIPINWKARTRYSGTYDAGWKARAPYFPADFDWRFFNAAPEELQVPFLRGDEEYWIRGVDPVGKVVDGKLPGIRVRTFALLAAQPDELRELPMNLDTVHFDTHTKKLVLVWRGGMPTVDQFGTDIAAFLVRADPVDHLAPAAENHRVYREEYTKEYEWHLEDDPDEVDEEEQDDAPKGATHPPPPDGRPPVFDDEADETVMQAGPPISDPAGDRRPPKGLTPKMAAALGLPPSAATNLWQDEETTAADDFVPPPPAPTPALSRDEIDELLADKDAPLLELDFSRCDLSGRDFRGRALMGSVLSAADLRGASFRGSDMRGCVLNEVQADGNDFSDANLEGADFTLANLAGADFRSSNLTEASLDRARCSGANFEGATLVEMSANEADFARARFDGAEAHAADLTSSVLEGASMVGLKAEDLRLYDVQGRGLIANDAKLDRLRADGAQLPASSFQRVEAPDSSIRQADLTGADFRQSKLDESVFEDSNLEGAIFSQVEAKECRWPRTRAKNASFLKANLMDGYFESAIFDGADLRGANLFNADTFRASFRGADLTHAILGNSGLE